MIEGTHKVGIPLTTGYLTAQIEADSETDALELIKGMVEDGTEVDGTFNMPACPGHASAPMILNPTHVVGYVIVR